LKVFAAAAALAAVFVSGATQAATPTHSYEFSGNLADQLGGASMQLNPGAPSSYSGVGDAAGFDFAFNQGPNVANAFASSDIYSIEMYFSLDSVGGGYRRLVDFKNNTTDEGLYYLGDSLVLYNTNLPFDVNATSGQLAHLVLTRDAGSQFKVYYNGALALSQSDAAGRARLTGPNRIVRFFDDDGSSEASSGFVDFIRTYDVALGASDVAGLYNAGAPVRVDGVGAVPEPATWAMMILGLGGVGAAMRARRRALVAA